MTVPSRTWLCTAHPQQPTLCAEARGPGWTWSGRLCWMWLFKQWHTFCSASKWIQMRNYGLCAAVHVYIVGAQTDSRLLFMPKTQSSNLIWVGWVIPSLPSPLPLLGSSSFDSDDFSNQSIHRLHWPPTVCRFFGAPQWKWCPIGLFSLLNLTPANVAEMKAPNTPPFTRHSVNMAHSNATAALLVWIGLSHEIHESNPHV